MEKECAICGVLFETDNPIRKYCDKCKDHPEAERRKMEIALACNKKRMYEPTTQDVTCELCGRHNVIPTHLMCHVTYPSTSSSDGHDHVFCCREHRDEWMDKDKRLHAVCAQCGSPMPNSPRYVKGAANQFCSDECHYAFKLAAARKAGNVHTCVYCKKEYIRPSKNRPTYFCSMECKRKAVAEGWAANRREQVRKSKEVIVKHKCSECGKVFEKVYKDKDYAYQAVHTPGIHFCSDECTKAYRNRNKAKMKAKIKADEEKKEVQFREAVDLCATCTTPYKQCERMSSNFRIIPEGAHYNDKGKLAICPKYKPPINKKGGCKK